MAYGQPCNVSGSGQYGRCPQSNEYCVPVSGDIGTCAPTSLPPPGSPGYPSPGPGPGDSTQTCPDGHAPVWDPVKMRHCCAGYPCPDPEPPSLQCPPGERPNPGGTRCVPIAAPTIGPPGSQTITDLLSRFYTPNWDDYLLSGVLDTGVPQPTGSLLDLLTNGLFQQSVGRYGIGPMQQWQMASQFRPGPQPNREGPHAQGGIRFPANPGERPEGILGLQGGAAALGYIDPAWLHDWTTRTVSTPGAPLPAPGAPVPPPSTTSGNPCGGAQGCPPGQHRKGCHPGNPCTPDNVMTGQVLGSRPAPTTNSVSNTAALLNPGSLTSGLGLNLTSQALGR